MWDWGPVKRLGEPGHTACREGPIEPTQLARQVTPRLKLWRRAGARSNGEVKDELDIVVGVKNELDDVVNSNNGGGSSCGVIGKVIESQGSAPVDNKLGCGEQQQR